MNITDYLYDLQHGLLVGPSRVTPFGIQYDPRSSPITNACVNPYTGYADFGYCQGIVEDLEFHRGRLLGLGAGSVDLSSLEPLILLAGVGLIGYILATRKRRKRAH